MDTKEKITKIISALVCYMRQHEALAAADGLPKCSCECCEQAREIVIKCISSPPMNTTGTKT